MSKAQFVANADFALYTRQLTPKMANDPIQTGFYQGEFDRLKTLSLSPDAGDHFTLYGWAAFPTLFEATGNVQYLRDFIEIINNVFSSATPSNTHPSGTSLNGSTYAYYNDTYLGWYSTVVDDGQGGYETRSYNGYTWAQGQFQLYSSERFTDIVKMLRILHRNPNLRSDPTVFQGKTMQQHYDYILNFIEVNHWEKWFSRDPAIYRYSGMNSTAGWGNMAYMLWVITGKPEYYDIYDKVNNDVGHPGFTGGIRQRLQVNPADALAYTMPQRFDETLYLGRSSNDMGHAGIVVKFMVNDYLNGDQVYNLSDMTKLVRTVNNVTWPASIGNDKLYFWLDGVPSQNSTLPGTKDPSDTSGYSDEQMLLRNWVDLGIFDSGLQTRFEGMPETYFVNDRIAGDWWGSLAWNRAYLEDTLYSELIELPELIRRKKAAQSLFIST